MTERFGQYGKHRLIEMIPGLLVWTTFTAAAVLAFAAPLIAIIFIIIFDLYWTLRVFYFIIHVLAAYQTYRKTVGVDWYAKLKELPAWESVYHLVMLPTYGESLPILDDALRTLKDGVYRNDRIMVVLGGEARDHENFTFFRDALEEKYRGVFAELLFTEHPQDVPGEIPGKGSNLRFMATEARKIIDARTIPYKDIVVSAFDVDTVAHEQYFARLAYLYITVPNPTRTSYQPVTLFSNNIWTSTAPVRIAAFGTTFWLFAELVRPERMWTFSSHSMPWQMLVDVGYWEPDLVSEDSRIFMQAFLHYDGAYRVTPIYLPVSMDAVSGKTYVESLVALYKQQRRWAWGVEHLPYMVAEFRKHPALPKRLKFRYLFNHLEGMYTWATAPFLIFALGYLPFLTVGNSSSALVVNSPYTLEIMMRLATLGVFVTGALSLMLLPTRPKAKTPFNWLVMVAQWALLPVTSVLFGSLPALDAQTRFMFGKYLGFNVTKKERREEP